ncbi:hypothetical protein E4U32_005665 [Claviceps aff. humidiphila group G2b]|nr:hypothetical protein E4U32_005665 [Claviceps aff. humidiphila group G2b]
MRLLTTLAFASGALALATGPVQHPADQRTVEGDALLNAENAVLVTPEITSRDETVPSSELEKRMGGTQATIRLPTEPSPASIVIAGVTVSFIMTYRWVERQGMNAKQYYVEYVKFHNRNRERKLVQAVANGAFIQDRLMESGFSQTRDAPQGITNFVLTVADSRDGEL